jgi:GntR family transcriptional regulator
LTQKDIQISCNCKKCIEELEREGFSEIFPAKSSFVTAKNKERLKEKQLKVIEDLLTKIINDSKAFNISLDELMNILTLLYEDDDGGYCGDSPTYQRKK